VKDLEIKQQNNEKRSGLVATTTRQSSQTVRVQDLTINIPSLWRDLKTLMSKRDGSNNRRENHRQLPRDESSKPPTTNSSKSGDNAFDGI
jgi:hypothetical protein